MHIQLLQGRFSKQDALDLIAQMIQTKISFHEKKIELSHNEEDIKMRESRIKQLQNSLADVRRQLNGSDEAISLHAQIEISQ
ncbi:MAG TPA: hypothetical protein VHB70_02285 [Parafilimonas sp.]|nr:hypothetical protein [Parafilimonas sp.]